MPKVTTPLGDFPVLPYPPRVPTKEWLRWVTDVFESKDGTETREQLRELPRQSFEYMIPMQNWKKIADSNTLKGAVGEIWLVPIWTEAQYVGSVTTGQTVVSVDVEDYHFYGVDSLCFFWNQRTGEYQICQVDTVTTTLNLESPGLVEDNYLYVMPLKQAYISGAPMNKTNGYNDVVSIRFDIIDSAEIVNFTGSYTGNFYQPSLGEGGFVERRIHTRSDSVDYTIGTFEKISPWTFTKYGMPFQYMVRDSADIWGLKNFLYCTAGRKGEFLTPTFENDFKVKSAGSTAYQIDVESGSIIDFDMLTDRYKIGILSASGWEVKTVNSSSQLDQTTVRITFTEEVTTSIEDIYMISYMANCRLDTDLIELEWIGNNTIKTQFQLLEIKL